jgi:SAM-dependent methyltransferase
VNSTSRTGDAVRSAIQSLRSGVRTYDDLHADEWSTYCYSGASRVLPLVLKAVPARSLVDVGCGPGLWLRAAKELGVMDLAGVEGPWAKEWFEQNAGLSRDEFQLVQQDLEQRIVVGRRFDLAISLEVAEHLTPQRAETFVQDLCSLAPHILFSAAIPGQGGLDHKNEQLLSWWSELFGRLDYGPLDFLRPQIWSDAAIPAFYRQNTILFVHEATRDEVLARTEDVSGPLHSSVLDVVHPEILNDRASPGLRQRLKLAAGIPQTILRRVRRRSPAPPGVDGSRSC